MNLATPAPKVEPALASAAPNEDPGLASIAQQSEPVRVDAAPSVEPAIVMPSHPSFLQKQIEEESKRNLLSVTSLRGTSGVDFESYAAVLRGAPPKNCLKIWLPCLYDERDFISYGEVKKYAVIKGSSCFIYSVLTDLSPLYAIPLNEIYPVLEDPNHPDKCSITVSPTHQNKPNPNIATVLFKYKEDHNQAYQFSFDISNDRSLPKRFMDAVETASSRSKPEKDVVTASILKVDLVAQKAANFQPEI